MGSLLFNFKPTEVPAFSKPWLESLIKPQFKYAVSNIHKFKLYIMEARFLLKIKLIVIGVILIAPVMTIIL